MNPLRGSGRRRSGRDSLFAALLGLAMCASSSCASSSDRAAADRPGEIVVAAASDLRPVFDQLGETFTKNTGISIRFSYGSSGQLREQLLQGAPFDLFASASESDVDEVIAGGQGIPQTKLVVGEGRIVIVAADGVELPTALAAMASRTSDRIAVAQPDHAPYGRAAVQALNSAGVVEETATNIVYGENAADALRLVESGNADLGLVAKSLAVKSGRSFTEVPESSYETIRQTLVVTSGGTKGKAAEQFVDLLRSAAGSKVLQRYGFVVSAPTTSSLIRRQSS